MDLSREDIVRVGGLVERMLRMEPDARAEARDLVRILISGENDECWGCTIDALM